MLSSSSSVMDAGRGPSPLSSSASQASTGRRRMVAQRGGERGPGEFGQQQVDRDSEGDRVGGQRAGARSAGEMSAA